MEARTPGSKPVKSACFFWLISSFGTPVAWNPASGGEGVLTDKWYTGKLKGFEVHFRKFWYIDGWVFVTYPMCPICKIGCILENLAKKAPNLPQIGCFLQKNGVEMGHKITLFEV